MSDANTTIISSAAVSSWAYVYEPTCNLKFIGGKLHQQWHRCDGDGQAKFEWRIVPSEDAPDAPQ